MKRFNLMCISINTLIKLCLLTTLTLSQISAAFAGSDVTSLGDSLTAGLANDGRGRITCLALNGITIAADAQRTCRGNGLVNIGGWQPLLSTLNNSDIFNFGNTDETSDEILARSARDIAARQSDTVLILAGTNDVIRNVPIAQIVQNLILIIDNVIASGRRPIIGTIPPLVGSRFASRNSAVSETGRNITPVTSFTLAQQEIASWPKYGCRRLSTNLALNRVLLCLQFLTCY